MQHFADYVQDQFGTAQSRASVLVSLDDGSVATIYSDNGVTPTANPITAGTDGRYDFYAANGSYTVTSSNGSKPITLFDPADLSAATGAGLVGFDASETYAAGTVGAKLGEVVSVKDEPFGAVGDGVTDDTAAIQAAYDYIAPRHGVLHFPLGNYICSGLDLGNASDNRACTFLGDSSDFLTQYLGSPNIETFPVSKITLKDGSDRSLFTVVDSWGFHKFENLLLLGNKTNQATPAYIIHLDDTASYKSGIKLKNVAMQSGSGGGLYIGRNRGSSTLIGVGAKDCGTTTSHHGIYVNCYDTYIEDAYLGGATGYNLYLDNCSQVYGLGVNAYQAGEGGVYVGAGCNGLYISGGSFDRNEKHGLYICKGPSSASGWNGNRFFSGVRFLGNSNAATNTYADVYFADDSTDTVFSQCDWQGEAGTGNPQPKHYFEFVDTDAKVRLLGCKLDETGYGTALTNNWPSIQSSDMPNFGGQMVSATQMALMAGAYQSIKLDKTTGEVDFSGPISFGGAATYAGISFRNVRGITGATYSIATLVDGTVQSDVTGSAQYFSTNSNTAAASFTIPDLFHYRANQNSVGAGSSITRQYGFSVASTLTGATTNYGFHSGLNAASGVWAFYGGGTAASYLGGALTWKPAASATPAANGDLTVEATSDTSLTFKLKGSDGVVRTAALTLA